MARRPRASEICLDECQTYHVITRCTRQLHLLAGDEASPTGRKDFLLNQLERVATFTAVGVAGFSVMDNHLHLLLKVDTEAARTWSSREVVRRWLGLHPPRDGYRNRVEVEDAHVDAVLETADDADLASLREKLGSISQFMKELKQAVTEKFNRLDETVGSVWAGRFKAKRVTDEAQLLTTLAYIDLNPFAAKLCDTPEAGQHTSLAARLHGVSRTVDELNEPPHCSATRGPSDDDDDVAESHATPAECAGWWMSIGGGEPGRKNAHRALIPGSTLTFVRYLKLLDRLARILRRGKQSLAGDATPVLDRLTVTPRGLARTLGDWFEKGLPWDRPRPAGG